MSTSDYPFIRAWGKMLGSGQPYIEEQVARARADKAPANATFRDHDSGGWQTTDDVTAQGTRFQLGLPPIEPDALAVMRKYGATLHPAAVTEPGSAVFVFPSLPAAVSWADEYRVTDRVQLRTGHSAIGFGEPVTVVLRPAASE